MSKCLVFQSYFLPLSPSSPPVLTHIIHTLCPVLEQLCIFIPPKLCSCYAQNIPTSSFALPLPTCQHLTIPVQGPAQVSLNSVKPFQSLSEETNPSLLCFSYSLFSFYFFRLNHNYLFLKVGTISHLSLYPQYLTYCLAILRCCFFFFSFFLKIA